MFVLKILPRGKYAHFKTVQKFKNQSYELEGEKFFGEVMHWRNDDMVK